MASLVAASALLIDYNLTAAVSTSSAVEQIVSAFPALVRRPGARSGSARSALITLANLRGLREAGNIFAVPTYLFMFSAFAMIAIGTYRIVVLGEHHDAPAGGRGRDRRHGRRRVDRPAPARVRLRRGRPDRHGGHRHRRPGVQAARGRRTPRRPCWSWPASWPSCSSGITFLAVELRDLSDRPGAVRRGGRAQDGHRPGGRGRLRQLDRRSTCSRPSRRCSCSWPRTRRFAAFPRLAAVLGEDGFFPRQFSLRGDRLAFSMGIMLLGIVAASLVIAAGGRTHALIPLYAVGVFIDFTISQAGHDPALAADPRSGLAAAPDHQRRRLRRDGHRRRRRDHRQVPRRGVARASCSSPSSSR